MTLEATQCLNCRRTEEAVPLITLQFMGGNVWMCPQCLPILIHSPHKLTGKLPGAETMDGAEHSH